MRPPSSGKNLVESRHVPGRAQPLVELRQVARTYRDGGVRALDGVSLSIPAGEFLSIMGPSGCGKSTLLHMIGALDVPTAGEVLFRGVPLAAVDDLDRLRAREIGFVFQTFYLLPNLTARENVQLPMFGDGRAEAERARRADELLALVGLANRSDHLPTQLSIGQRQRVAIARALANDPALVLADEPTGSLDSRSGAEVMDLLGRLHAEHGTTLVVVTHDAAVAARARRTIRMLDGRIVDDQASA
jgi:putative ABC transport system ATP-binding protein